MIRTLALSLVAAVAAGTLIGAARSGPPVIERSAAASAAPVRSRARSAYADQICPISPENQEKAAASFKQLHATMTGEARCTNCHGALDPFMPGTRHVGGVQKVIGSVNVAEDRLATDKQCQDCHGEARDWGLAPVSKSFNGRNIGSLCGQFRRNGTSPDEIADHIAKDRLITVGFAGTRGLNDVGQALVNGGYRPLPITAVRQADLAKVAAEWSRALGDQWSGDDQCGCVVEEFALRIVETFTLENEGMSIKGRSSATIPVRFTGASSASNRFDRESGSFEIAGIGTREATLTGNAASCKGAFTTLVHWTMKGDVTGGGQGGEPATLVGKQFSIEGEPTSGRMECAVNGQSAAVPIQVPGGRATLPPLTFRELDVVQTVSLPIPTMGVMNGENGSTESASFSIIRIK